MVLTLVLFSPLPHPPLVKTDLKIGSVRTVMPRLLIPHTTFRSQAKVFGVTPTQHVIAAMWRRELL